MEKYLIALDLDGTLLKDDKTISDTTLETIAKVQELGHCVMIATGRPYRSSKMYYDELQLQTPIVNFNGAYIHHPNDASFGTYHTPLELETAKEIIKTCDEVYHTKNIMAEIIDEVYLHAYDEKIMEIVSVGNPMTQTGNLYRALSKGPTSLLIHPKEEEAETIRAYLAKTFNNKIDHRKWGAPWHVIEIVKAGINKMVGVKKVAEYYGIATEHIISFGDEDNDLELIGEAGIGVAMGNAIDELKNVAKEVTLTNEQDGVAHFLKHKFNLR